MSSNGTRQFSPTGNSPGIYNATGVERGTFYQNINSSPKPPPVRGPQPQYPSINVGSFENHGQAYQRRVSNEASLGSYETSSQMGRTGASPQSPEQYRAYDKNQYGGPSPNPSLTAQYEANTYQYRSSPGVSIAQGSSPQPASTHKRESSRTFTPISRKEVPYPSPPSQGQDFQYPSAPRELGVRHSSNPSQRDVSPYDSPANATLTPDRSVIGSPLPQMSPDSLQRELERTKDYSENILTKLIETTNLLKERDAEITQLHHRLATAGGSGGHFQRQGGGSSWEIDDLRRKLYEHSQALQAAEDQARYQQSQADQWARECSQLRDSLRQNQQQPQVNPAQMEEARNVTEFYKQKVDQLSRDNMNITQQNRKLTEDLAAAQRDVQQQRTRIR